MGSVDRLWRCLRRLPSAIRSNDSLNVIKYSHRSSPSRDMPRDAPKCAEIGSPSLLTPPRAYSRTPRREETPSTPPAGHSSPFSAVERSRRPVDGPAESARRLAGTAEDPPKIRRDSPGLWAPASACHRVVGRLEERNARRRRAAVVEAPRGVRSGVRDVAALGAVAAGSKVVRREPDAAALQEGEATRGRGGGQGAPVHSWRCGGKGKASGGEAGSAPVDEVVWKGAVGAQAAVLAVAPRAACEEGSEKGPRQPPAAAAAAPPPSPASFDDVHRLGEDQPVLPPRVAA